MTEKKERLRNLINAQKRILVALSGGLDSTVLLAFIKAECRVDVCAYMVLMDMLPPSEIARSREFCEKWDIPFFTCVLHELQLDGFQNNPPDRCYLCKRALFSLVQNEAKQRDIHYIADGSIVDDLDDYRPGMKALKELSIASPLLECGFTKEDVVEMGDAYGIELAHQQKFSCYYTRFKTGSPICRELFEVIRKTEEYLMKEGCKRVRVRVTDDCARIEVDANDIEKVAKPFVRKRILKQLAQGRFSHVVLDMEGYQQGSMN